MSTGAKRNGVPGHQVWNPNASPVIAETSETTNTPNAAGLRMWRPRIAMRYLDAAASRQAAAMPTSPSGFSVGGRIMATRNAVTNADSRCGVTRNSFANSQLAPVDTANATAIDARSSRGPDRNCPKSDSTRATVAMTASTMSTSLYIVR